MVINTDRLKKAAKKMSGSKRQGIAPFCSKRNAGFTDLDLWKHINRNE